MLVRAAKPAAASVCGVGIDAVLVFISRLRERETDRQTDRQMMLMMRRVVVPEERKDMIDSRTCGSPIAAARVTFVQSSFIYASRSCFLDPPPYFTVGDPKKAWPGFQ